MLEASKAELMGKVDEYADQKIKNLAAQKDDSSDPAGQLSVICKGEPEDRKPGRSDENEEDRHETDQGDDRQLQTRHAASL